MANIKATILPFKGVHDYCAYWDKIVAESKGKRDSYANWLNRFKKEINDDLSNGATRENVIAYGEPMPSSYDEAKDRKYFMNMPLYNNSYQELKPFLSRLEKISQGIIPKEVIKPNDRELGVFSFERAMMSIEGTPALYSDKTKKFYSMNEGEELFGKDKKQLTTKEGHLKFKLIKSGEEVYLTQLEEDGDKQFNSSNKKSFLHKEKYPRPNRTVRLFVLVGQNWGQQTFWAGVCAVICATFLESVGYAVRITAVMGVSMDGLNFGGGKKDYGHRFNTMDVKDYTETIDSLSLLYVLADPSFFRIRQFEYYVAQQYKYQDTYNPSLGSMPSVQTFETALYQEIKKRNLEEEKDTLYYFMGGSEITSIENSKEELIRIICNAENRNKEILMKLGYEFNPPDPSDAKKHEDFDCADYI